MAPCPGSPNRDPRQVRSSSPLPARSGEDQGEGRFRLHIYSLGSVFVNRCQYISHRFRLRLRAEVSFALQTDGDVSDFHIAGTNDEDGVDAESMGVGDHGLIGAAVRPSLARTMSARSSLNADIMANAVERFAMAERSVPTVKSSLRFKTTLVAAHPSCDPLKPAEINAAIEIA